MNDVPGATSKDTFVKSPDKLMTEIVVKDERNMLAYHYRVQDTPGTYAFGPFIVHAMLTARGVMDWLEQ